MRIEDENIMCGGTVDHSDPGAPKVIHSKDLTALNAHFYLYYGWSMDRNGRGYSFQLKRDAGQLVLSEYGSRLQCPVDDSLLTRVREIIDRYKLVRLNGQHRCTAGLPDPYQPCSLDALYASGEMLSFSHNNDPFSEWAKALRKLFSEEFAAHGMPDLLPPENAVLVTRLRFERVTDGIASNYTDINMPVNDGLDGFELKLRRSVRDRDQDGKVSERLIPFPEDYFEQVSWILSQYDLNDGPSGQVPGGPVQPAAASDPEAADSFRLYVEYENGKVINLSSSDPEQIVQHLSLLDELTGYLDSLFD